MPQLGARIVTNKRIAGKRQVSDSVLQAIEKYNDLDLQLYQYAQERFAQEIVDYGDSFKDDLERFQQANKNFLPAEKGRSFLQRGVAFAKGAAKKIELISFFHF